MELFLKERVAGLSLRGLAEPMRINCPAVPYNVIEVVLLLGFKPAAVVSTLTNCNT
jgi:hypothetical protein